MENQSTICVCGETKSKVSARCTKCRKKASQTVTKSPSDARNTTEYLCLVAMNSGLSNAEISRALKISKTTVSRYLSNKAIKTRAAYKEPPLALLYKKIQAFHRDNNGKAQKLTFNQHDVIEKFGRYTKCYLTGCPIDLYDSSSYECDHIVSRSSGGTNEIDNLGIATPIANRMKHTMSEDELLNQCVKVLTLRGFQIKAPA